MKVLNGERGCRDIGVTVFGGGGEGRVPTQRLSDSRVNETVKHSFPCRNVPSQRTRPTRLQV